MGDAVPHVLIVGAGDTGLTLATMLSSAGLRVSTLNRSGRSIDAATALVGDLADSASLMGLPSADVVVFTTAPPSRDDEGYRTAYLDGPQRLLDALPTEPARAVLTSTTGVYGADDGRWVTATTPPDPSRSTAAIVVEGEAALARRIPTTVVRSAGIYGPGRRRLIDQVLTGVVGVTPGMPARWTNRVHRDDLAAALALCVTHPSPPPVVIAVDDESKLMYQLSSTSIVIIGISNPRADTILSTCACREQTGARTEPTTSQSPTATAVSE